jgi:hypothetical protein
MHPRLMDNYQITPAENGCGVWDGHPPTKTISSQKPVYATADRLLDWHDQAKLAGRIARANVLLDLAWCAFYLPAYRNRLKHTHASHERGRSMLQLPAEPMRRVQSLDEGESASGRQISRTTGSALGQSKTEGMCNDRLTRVSLSTANRR